MGNYGIDCFYTSCYLNMCFIKQISRAELQTGCRKCSFHGLAECLKFVRLEYSHNSGWSIAMFLRYYM